MNDDWSDSDDENTSEVETPVLLGVPDAPIHLASDLNDAAVSRIGGHPAFLPSSEPSFSSSCCHSCSFPMELLMQVWCPFEDSPMDRALYVWGCSSSACQGKKGSVRAWRGLRFNREYAAELEKKRAAKATSQATVAHSESKTNPFSLGGQPSPQVGLGAQLFGAEPLKSARQQIVEVKDSTSDSSDDALITAMTSASLLDSPWRDAPCYPPIYLSTMNEYLPPQPKPKIPAGLPVPVPYSDNLSKNDVSWASEPYENSLETDKVFDRFSKIVSCEGEQCLRYELGGVPLPFASDSIFDYLFPVSVGNSSRRTFQPSSLPPCPICHSRRIFECQLMPNLINVCRPESDQKETLSDGQRRKAVEEILQRKAVKGRRGMEWGTCLIFSCARDCCLEVEAGDAKECWREEHVVIQREV